MRSAIVFTLIASFCVSASADESDFDTVRKSAYPKKRVAPIYPSVELRRSRQGWVDLSFVVTAEGKVIDPIVVDSSGSPFFERAAKNAALKFEYEPATINGEPVQQCETKTRIAFTLDGPTGAVSRDFYRRYKRIESALDDRELDKATELIDEAFEAEGISMAENAWLWTARTRLSGMRGDLDDQLVAVRRATSNAGWVDEGLYPSLLTIRTSLEIDNGLYADALYSFSLLDETGYSDANTESLRRAINTIEDHVLSDKILSVSGQIEAKEDCDDCRANWKHDPLRRQFRIANVNGTLEELEVRCKWQRFIDRIDTMGVQIWELPPSWGSCAVFVFGEPGTTFDFHEVPSGYMSSD